MVEQSGYPSRTRRSLPRIAVRPVSSIGHWSLYPLDIILRQAHGETRYHGRGYSTGSWTLIGREGVLLGIEGGRIPLLRREPAPFFNVSRMQAPVERNVGFSGLRQERSLCSSWIRSTVALARRTSCSIASQTRWSMMMRQQRPRGNVSLSGLWLPSSQLQYLADCTSLSKPLPNGNTRCWLNEANLIWTPVQWSPCGTSLAGNQDCLASHRSGRSSQGANR